MRLSHSVRSSADHDSANETFQPRSLAVLGTGSDVGKSIITAGVCRVLSRSGVRVTPFKAQNMSNNATPALIANLSPFDADGATREAGPFDNHITPAEEDNGKDEAVDQGNVTSNADNGSWGEIGAAQALQSHACGLIPRVEMNPVLLKSGGQSPAGDYLCSIIVLGKHFTTQPYGALGTQTSQIMELVLQAHSECARVTKSEVVICEGAGSCTELNLMERDVVNLPLVRKLGCPWLLVADIDKGGVFAQVVGTQACVTPADWELCCGVIVNRLRGDPKYFEPGPAIIEERVGKPVFVVPWLYGLHLPEEDGVGVETRLSWEKNNVGGGGGINSTTAATSDGKEIFNVVVVAYPYVAIDSDLVPLERDPSIHLQWHRDVLPPPFPRTHAIILPGSRLTCSDLEWLTNETKWGDFLKEHVKCGGAVFGICGGYQMMGMWVRDENRVEGVAKVGSRTGSRVHGGEEEKGADASTRGLGLLPVVTTMAALDHKVVAPRTVILDGKEVIEGFEIHCGRTVSVMDEDCDDVCWNRNFDMESSRPLLHLKDTHNSDGMRCGRVAGCYLHGILANQYARYSLLNLPLELIDNEGPRNEADSLMESLDKLADHLEVFGLTSEKITEMYSSIS